MLHTKSPGHWLPGSGEEEILKGFYHIWAWWPSLSTLAKRAKVNLDHWNLLIAIVSLVLPYQVRISTLAYTVFKKSTFQKKIPFKCIRKQIWPYLNKLGRPNTHNATYQVPKSSAFWFWRRRFLKGFSHIWAWRPSWSCDQDHLNKLSFPHPKESLYEIWV